MQHIKKCWRKLLSGALAVILAFGLVPPADVMAAPAPDNMPSTIKLDSVNYDSVTYTSPNGLGKCYIHNFYMDINGSKDTGFCYDHSLDMGRQHVGNKWNYEK